nr:MAG TPA: RRN7 Zinc-finger of RNA-polymerase I-specific TFIIB, Rrn7 [Caudoviricetes sp.]
MNVTFTRIIHLKFIIFANSFIKFTFRHLITSLFGYDSSKCLRCGLFNLDLDYHISGITLCPKCITTLGW